LLLRKWGRGIRNGLYCGGGLTDEGKNEIDLPRRTGKWENSETGGGGLTKNCKTCKVKKKARAAS